MARSRKVAPAKLGQAAYSAPKSLVTDSFQNFAARTGVGTGNLNDGATYGFNPISRNRLQLEWGYRGSWIMGRAVDCIPEDMTREGIEVKSDDDPDDLSALEKQTNQLEVWGNLCDSLKWARLYGGAVAMMMIDGQEHGDAAAARDDPRGSVQGTAAARSLDAAALAQ